MRKLYLGNGDKQFKFADTTTEINLNAFDDGSAAALTADAKVRIKNDSGYLLGVSASITNNHAVITSGQLAQLPVGSYLIELWNTVDGGTAIYPSDGFLALQINENVTGLSGGLVSSITVDDFIQQFSDLSHQLKQEVAVAIANGLKGDTGDDGLSAYQIAVINGYQGSQTEWLTSLVGPQGIPGPVVSDGTISLPMLDDQLKSNFLAIGEFTPQLSGVGSVNVANGKVIDFGTQSYWSHAQYNVAENSNLYISFRKSNNTAVTGHIFATDDNNTILASFVPGSGDKENLDNYAIVTPAGTTKLFIQSFEKYQISVIGEMYKSLSASIDEKNTDLKQEIDNELKIYKEMNNSNVYNFISRQGMLGGYPENSNASVLNAKQNGFNYVRVSVAFTSDNVPVLIHDPTINRLARNLDGSVISSTINIADITLEQANTYDWGIVAGQNHKGMKIPLLSDFLKICSFKSIFPTLEFKPNTATDEQLGSIINMVNNYGLIDKTYFTSTVDAILLSVNKINPSINIGLIAHLNLNAKVDAALKFKTEFNDVRIDMFDSDTPSVDVINYASSKGVGIKVGSAYSLADIVKFASMGVTDIEVAYVAFPATALNEYYDNL